MIKWRSEVGKLATEFERQRPQTDLDDMAGQHQQRYARYKRDIRPEPDADSALLHIPAHLRDDKCKNERMNDDSAEGGCDADE